MYISKITKLEQLVLLWRVNIEFIFFEFYKGTMKFQVDFVVIISLIIFYDKIIVVLFSIINIIKFYKLLIKFR